MKILYLLHNDPNAGGGTEKHAMQLASTASLSHNVAFLYPKVTKQDIEPDIREYTSNGITYFELNRKVHNNFLPPDRHEKKLNQLYEDILLANKYDVIHIHHLKNLPSGCLPISFISGARVVFSLQDYEFFCMQTHLVRGNGDFCENSGGGANCSIYCSPKVLRAKAKLARPFSAITGESAFEKHIKHLFLNRKMAFKKIHSVLAASQYVIDRFKSEGFESPNVKLLELGINQFVTPARKPVALPIKFVFLGNINKEKGVDLLIETFKKIPPDKASISMYGSFVSDDVRDQLDAAVKNYPNIKHEGSFSDSSLPDILYNADCLINPTRRHETFSLVLSEAWMAKLPVIAAASGALSTRIRNNVDGFLIEPDNLSELTDVINKVVGNPAVLDDMRSNIREVMTIKKYYQEIEKIYQGLS